VEWVIDLFADDGKYQRAEAIYSGKQAIADFYRGDRKIQGRHSLEHVVAEANTVIANGVFEGVGADGSPKKIGFADAWQFDSDGLVNSRKTYLAAGSDYVKD
jgi:hypothetical protein